jgi:hypothetical protein
MSDPEAALQRAVADACLSAGAGEAMAGDLRAFLEERGVQPEDVEAIVAAPARLAVYRSLVRNGLASVVARMLPRTRARLDAAIADRFDADVAAFLDQVGPRTHYLRDVPAELFAWVAPRWRSDARVPRYLVDLAAHELAQFAVGAAAPSRTPEQVAEIALDRPLAFAESMRLVAYSWAVHELPDDEGSTDVPVQRDVRLLAYRDAEHAVRWLELTPLAAAVLDRLAAGQALGAAVQAACGEHGIAPASALPDIARLLADLGERGVVVGARS